MSKEVEKMLRGELYDPFDEELVAARARARDLCQELNATRELEAERRRALLLDLFGAGGESVWMQPPFYCDYGRNIYLGNGSSLISIASCSMSAGSILAISRCLDQRCRFIRRRIQ